MLLYALLIASALSEGSSEADCNKKSSPGSLQTSNGPRTPNGPSTPTGPSTSADTTGHDCFSMHGDCDTTSNCVMSKNYPNKHGNRDTCWVTMKMTCNLEVSDPFEVEHGNDHLMIKNKDRESKGDIPPTLEKGQEFSWITSSQTANKGWKICFTPPKCVSPTDKTGFEVVENKLTMSDDKFDVTAVCSDTHEGTAVVKMCERDQTPYDLSGCTKKTSAPTQAPVTQAPTESPTKKKMCIAPNKDCYDVTETSLELNNFKVDVKCDSACVADNPKVQKCTADGGAYKLTGCSKKCFRIENTGCKSDDNKCITSNNYPKTYNNNELCNVVMLTDCDLDVKDFDVDTDNDHINMQNKDMEDLAGFPTKLGPSVANGDNWTWHTGVHGQNNKGWKICFKVSAARNMEEDDDILELTTL